MEPEGTLPYLQVPVTCPYPVPARSSPYPHEKGFLISRRIQSRPALDRRYSYLPQGGGSAEWFGARYSVLVRTGPEAHQLPIQWLPGLFLGDGVDHPTHPAPKLKKVYRNSSPSPSGSSWPVAGGNLNFFLFTVKAKLYKDQYKSTNW
jgi:hypothetical protein